ncbi:hypothetical protein AAFF_G00397260 [Aldrovandia affinis]|uniref:Sacsin n=1 Tax=Aldrovandia affinis TaxID=143900 RepID=A0AAD7SDA8_9TELE|nr:hypothetical protein AAFF_G00397260 [Aldrovandia affinis]
MAADPDTRLLRVTVLHKCISHRVFHVPPTVAVGDIKQLIYEEADFPVAEQQLFHNGRVLCDRVRTGSLVHAGSHEIFMTLRGRGLKGGGRFGQTTPPLVEFLKDILRRYPEGGQILKELIQNAEDAGATEVKFMYDETEYGRESLWSNDMAQYQGTALYVYNNAVFTMEDWNGIQEIARSRKRDDPLKVGRFGIGFNSVYHITDVPSIFSGDQIGMLDPHQTLFGPHESGQCWNLKSDIKEITEHADQFCPYVGLFGSSEQTLKEGSFPGTLFRFPLRVKPSQLSANIYNKEKVLELFESFKADADTVLLFLKSVQEVSLHVRESDGTERTLFRVTASEDSDRKLERPDSLKTLGLAIDSYSNGVLDKGGVTCATYQVNIETQDEAARETQRTAWLVCNGVGGRGMCAELDALADDLKFIPAIGIALPLTPVDEDQGAGAAFSGRAFCFLPLPPGEESATGLPVHVSGFFGLTDNRRSIKWREVDQWRDPAALWNELLVVNVIPRAYFTLVTEVVKRIQTTEDQNFPLPPWGAYGAWPDPGRVRPHWQAILAPLFQDLLQQRVVYSLEGSWIAARDAVFSELDEAEGSAQAVIGYLQSAGMQVATVPVAVDAVLTAYTPPPGMVAKVTPALVRQALRKTRHKGSSREKLLLLEFVLGDAGYSDLIGLELLPLQSEAFAAFSSSVSEKDAVYIASEEYPRSLYPGLEGRFILDSIKPTVMKSLKEAAKSRGRPCTQVQELTPERSARLIKEILTMAWPSRDFVVQWNPGNREKKHPSISWLKMVWKHLYIYFADDLSVFEDMPLIPNVLLEDDVDSLELLRLRTPSPIILVDDEEAPLPESLPDIMKKLGAVITKKVDPCLQHPLLKNYIHPASSSTLLHILDRSSSQRVVSQIASLSGKQKATLRGFLAGLSDVTEKEKRILLDLPIFEKIGPCTDKGTPIFIALRGAKALHHSAKLPSDVRLSIGIIDCSDEATIRLIKLLNVEQMQSTECLKMIVQDMEKSFYAKDEIIKIMLWALKHLSFLKNENPSVIQLLSSLKFIQASTGKPVAATDLFDPELEILQNLFYMEEKTRFPPSTYTSSPDTLHSLRQLGLKCEVQLNEKDVLQVARKIEDLQSNSKPDWDPLLRKAQTLLTILNKQTKLVKSSDAQASLQKLKWVPVCKDRPLNYPRSLAWMGDSFNISSLSDMCDISHAVLVGSSVALVERTSAGMKKALKLSIEPQVDQVLQHLKAVNDWHRSQAFTTEDWYQFQQILTEIYDFMQAHLEGAREAMKSLPFDWVWTGKTFSSPGQTVLKPMPDLDLQPYLYSLPKTIAKFHKLFQFCGSVEEVVPSHVFEVVKTVKKRSEQELTKEDSKQNLLLLINILRWLYNSQISVDLNMHVPILCYKDPSKLAMRPIHECTYCDIKVDDLNDLLDDVSEPIILVHDDIPMKTAEWLNVPCLSTRLINPENLGFEQSGQREPLTVRIKNILEEYPSVADIFKELLQNADDASATECSFLIDMRKNLEIRENLLDPGMVICHGPALWSFNNSVFSDTDFLNITRLGGSMKRCEADKVGKFGLGFNSVYHVTDIPIIMSREFMIMFDPNINHISKHIRDKSNPGIKINWSKQQKRLRKFPNQFKPFINVFNCQLPLSQESPYKFSGTLFRLPFRTEQEASMSEISSIYYNTTDIYSLVDEFSICGHRLILFTQHVGSMVLKYLKYEEPNPAASQDVVTINKSVWSSKAAYGPLSILKAAAKVMKKVANTNRVPADIPKSGCIIRIVVEEFHNVFRRIVDLQSPLFRGSDDDPSSYFEMAAKGGQTKRLTDEMPQKAVDLTNWLICSCMDVSEALKFSLSESGRRLGLVPCGGVAVLLLEGENRTWSVKSNPTAIGEVFCYLPLRIKTGLPVHINGCFAVTSNRKEIWKTDTKGNWNSVFMRHVIVQAYLAALSMLRSMAESGELVNYSYYAAWPDPGVVHDDFTLISQGVYQEIAKGGDSDVAKVFSDGSTWVSIKYVRFLDDSLLCRPDIGPAAFKIFLKYLKKSGSQDLCAVELPDWVKEGFDDAGCKGKLMENTLTEKQFFSNVFFPHIEDIDKNLRDPLMHYVLNEKLEEFAVILRETPCIPCSSQSHQLVVPSRLIHPEGRVAKLYNTEDGRFPEGTTKDYLNPVCLVKLVQLGMVKDDLSWEDLIERAESVVTLNEADHTAACLRSSILLSLVDEKLKVRDSKTDEYQEKLQNIHFLPFLTKPAGFSLPWYGNKFPPSTMFAATDLFTTDHQDTVCLLKPILNENSPSFKGCSMITLAVKDFLGLIKKPTVKLVVSQLNELSKSFDGVTLYQENITNACYKYLHEEMLQDNTAKEQIMEDLKTFCSILVENTYVNPSKVAFHLNFDSAPYLYQLPNKYRNSCRELFENVGVQSSFTVDNFSAVLEVVKKECGRKSLSEDNFQLCRRIISEGIWGLIRDKNPEFCQSNYGEILLPDTHLTLQPSKSLCYNDCPWIKVRDTTVKYCHSDIPREVAVKLGAVPKRHKALERYASNICFTTLGSEFGQKEKLTSRIKSILNAYPSEKEMLKELLQNADDAKATEIYFVADPRCHPTDRIFDDKWIPMQGPSLCVYNNQPFTEDDVRGIQNLGRGTKEANPGKTGQYGIGFNSVYHITDCPSFISNNDILCIFDPHAHYAPGATSVSPGRMFRDLDSDFRTQFSDVLNLYLGSHFKLERCTMFRFPLRTVDMARSSEISSVPASDRMVQNLLDKLRADGAELLMFLNHMEKISICEIDSTTGDLKVLYSVTAKITDGDRLKRKQFHASVVDSVTKKKQLTQIPVQQITYTMDIEDLDGNLTTWLDELQHLKNTEYNITTRKTVAENVYRLKAMLLEVGFNLVHSCDETASLYFCLEDAGIPVSYVTPEDVRSFLLTFSSPDSSCQVGKLPCRLQQSNFKLFHSLKLLVDYCFKDIEEDEITIEGLPLLITMDNILQVFDSKRPKYLTVYHDLIPSRKEQFMNTLYMRYSSILMKASVAKTFDISSFGDLLGSVLPREYRTRTFVKWKDNYASESWLKSVWHFISENICIKEEQTDIKPKFEIILDILKDWALLPGTKYMVSSNKLVVPDHDVLLPLSLIYAAIFPNGQNDKVFHTLMKGGCIQLAVNKMCSKENPVLPFLAQHAANIENPSSILKALEYMIQTSAFKTGSLTDKDFEALLLYMNCNLINLSQDDVQSLKLLPCYKAVSGRYISVSSFGCCYVLTKSIPSADMEKWAHTTSAAFLVDNPQLKELYTFLGCTPIDDLEVYLKHLLPKFDSLSHDAKIEHLIYLKARLLSIEEPCLVKDQLYEKLESLSFIYDANNRLKPAKTFFDQTVRVFEVMLPIKSFIPNDFFKKVEQSSKPKNGTTFLASWITFLRKIGLKYVVSQQQVLQFAKEVSIKAQTESWTKEKAQAIVEVLLNHIFNERTDLFVGTFLKELSIIPFLCPERAPGELIRLHAQHQEMVGTLPLIRFNGSQVNPKFKQTDIIQLLWTSCPILPEKGTPAGIKDQEGSTLASQEQLDLVLTMLNVNLEPPLDKVINNCKNICSLSNLDDDMVKTRNKVLRSTYEFLNSDKREFRINLRGTAFVMVEEGWKLLKPEEVVINLDNESDFKPYLYKLPLELGMFHQLFKLLGTEDIVSTKQYVEVLCRIYRNSEGKQLDPNEMRTVKRAVSGLFKSLQNDPVQIRKDLESLRDLTFYLPSHDGRLAKSNTLVFDDAPHYKSRIQGNFGVQMLVDMSQCYLGKDHAFHTKMIMLLPQKLRPRLLSSILEEQLDEESPKMCQFGALCSLQGRLQLLLSSEQFITGLIRIMKHENDNAFLVNEEKAIRLCKALCEGLKVSCFEKLQTTLRVKGCSPIPHSKSETLAFLKRYGTAVIHLYIQHSDSKDINFLLALAMTLKSATDNLISDTSYLIAMLGCNDIYRITEKLDNLGVKYDSSEPSKLELPLPGTPIPAEIHHILLMDPMNVFYPGEYVGYLVDSEGGDIYGTYQPTYTYAIIVQEVEREEEDNPSFLGKCFQIDIGYSEYKIVSSLDLYKFSRQDESTHIRDSAPSTPTSPSEGSSPGPRMVPPVFPGKENHRAPPSKISPKKIRLNALPEILKEVTLVIEQAWKLPESERKKIIRRLYLKWHPDKNAENLDIATEVFKHLQTEICRMEKQSLVDQNADRASRRPFSSSSTRFQSEKFSFQRFYTSWNQEATSHKSEKRQFREQYTSYAGSSHSNRFFVPPSFKSVGNPVEARRWLRQARANFSAARNDLHKNANEWVCFKCYLATKLALIAADYSVRGKSDKDVKPTALAQKVEEYSTQLAGLAKDVHILEGYGVDSLRTRYPDLLPFPQIPNDRYTSEVAMRVMECTARIIIKLETFVQQKV